MDSLKTYVDSSYYKREVNQKKHKLKLLNKVVIKINTDIHPPTRINTHKDTLTLPRNCTQTQSYEHTYTLACRHTCIRAYKHNHTHICVYKYI